MRIADPGNRSAGWAALLALLLGAVVGFEVQGQQPAQPRHTANDQWNFDVAERRMNEISGIGAQLIALSREPLPPGLSAADRTEAARFTHWLYNNSRKFHHLARGWGAFLQRVPRKGVADPVQLDRLQEMNRTFSLRYLNMINGATDEVLLFRFDHPGLRARHERVVRLIAHLQ